MRLERSVMDTLSDTPAIARPFCPSCEPEADELCQVLVVRWCSDHEPSREGLADATVPGERVHLNTAGEADGRECRIVAGLIR